MDITSLDYFIEATKELNLTKTATRLFMSQQTLSNHINRLETELGVKLFYRKPKLALTDAGRALLSFSHNVIVERSNLVNRLADIEGEKTGLLRLGASHLRARTGLPNILPRFYETCPKVSVSLTADNSINLVQMLKRGDLDMALSVIGEEEMGLDAELLLNDQLYICVADRLLKKYYSPKEIAAIKKKSVEGAYVGDFAKLPFAICVPPNKRGETIANCFEEADVTPNVYLSSTSVLLFNSITINALAACFISHTGLAEAIHTFPEDVNIFPLYYQGKPSSQTLYLIKARGHYLSSYMHTFADLLRDYYQSVAVKNLTRAAKD